jgi:signal transduction histidine kinase/ActR/RegA family two-component response regulator
VVSLVRESGRVEIVARVHVDDQQQLLLNDLLDRYPPDWNSPSAAVTALRTGRPELISDVPGAMLDAQSRDDEHRQRIEALNPRSMITVPILIRGKASGALQCVRGASQRRYTQDDLSVIVELAGRAATALENARLYEDLKEAQRQKDDFLAMLAHELRNPLAAIQYANQIAMLSDPSPSDSAETIDRQVKNLARLIDDLLDVSRITRDKIRLKKDAVDGAMLVRRAAASVQPMIASRKHSLAVEVSPEAMPLFVDATRMEQVLVNLLSNAAKYTAEGGQIVVRCYPENGNAVFRVQDNGVGIPSEILPRIFDLFTQADRSLDRSQGGLGIGLTVVRKLVEMHGGNVLAASDGLGRGSEFTVLIPLASPEEVLLGELPSPVMAARPRKILVVDDNVDTAQSLARLLTLAGHDVAMAHNGESALETARSTRPDIVLLDIGLPLMDGYRVAQTLRSDKRFERLRLIAVSGYGQAEDRRRSKEAGFDDHLVKPVNFGELLAAVERQDAD